MPVSRAVKTTVWLAGQSVWGGVVLFGLAGTVAWPAGWVFWLLMVACSIPLAVWMHRRRPALLEERMRSMTHARAGWDRGFLIGLRVLSMLWMALVPLDAMRYGWSHMPVWLQGVGLGVNLVGWGLFFVVYRANPYLTADIRFQPERSHQVIDIGPYRHVRHPMYTATVVYYMGASLLLGSWAGLGVTAAMLVALGMRTRYEEGLLRAELEGYEEYMGRVRWRLVPGVW